MGRHTSKRHPVPFVFLVVALASVRLSYAVAPQPSDDVDFGPSEACDEPYASENKNEQWVWKKICAGEEVDFNRRDGVHLDPRIAEPGREEWENRAINSRFLETVLLHEPYRSAIPRKGIQIVGAYFLGPLDLTDATLARPLSLTLTRFDFHVDLKHLRTNARVGLDKCSIPLLRMESASVAGSVSLKEADLGSLLISGARIEDNLTMNGAAFRDLLDMEGVIVAGDVALTGAPRMHTVEASKAKIGGEFVIGSARIQGNFRMDRARIGGAFVIGSARTQGNFQMDSGIVGGDFIIGGAGGGTTFDGEFILRGTEVGDQLSMVDVKFGDRAHLEAVAVGGTLFLRKSEIRGEANLRFIRVGRNLDASSPWNKIVGGLMPVEGVRT